MGEVEEQVSLDERLKTLENAVRSGLILTLTDEQRRDIAGIICSAIDCGKEVTILFIKEIFHLISWNVKLEEEISELRERVSRLERR